MVADEPVWISCRDLSSLTVLMKSAPCRAMTPCFIDRPNQKLARSGNDTPFH